MKPKRRLWLPLAFLGVLAVTRIPGVLPQNFSGMYALAFCAAVYLPLGMAWSVPLGFLFVTDLLLNALVYRAPLFSVFQVITVAGYVVLIMLGRNFRAGDSWLRLLGGGLVGAILFYLVTNTAAWLFNPFGNPEYTKDLTGWIIALTRGTGGYPETWEFFRNTMLSGGLFTGLFVGAMKMTESPETESEEVPGEAGEPAAEEAKS